MGADIIQVALTTFASGGLAALGAYVGVIWKLNSRVAKLEETVGGLKDKQVDLESNQNSMLEANAKEHKEIKESLDEAVDDIRDRQESSKKEIINVIGMLQKEMADFRVTCSDNRGAMVRKKEFTIFAEEEQKRWAEFYRMVGRLEGAMDRLSRRPPPLIKNSERG